jgi:hypothetical protein
MDAVPGSSSDSLPQGSVTCNVTILANGVGHVCVLLDLFRAFRDPQINLPRTRADGLLMTRVTRKLGVLTCSADHLVDSGIHYVTTGAELVRVLRVVPGHGSRRAGSGEEHHGCDS